MKFNLETESLEEFLKKRQLLPMKGYPTPADQPVTLIHKNVQIEQNRFDRATRENYNRRNFDQLEGDN